MSGHVNAKAENSAHSTSIVITVPILMNPPHEQVQDRDDAELHLHNSSSADAAYKKALKHYKKSAQHQKQSQGTDWTAFRAAEKKYKRRFPLCDTSNTLDLALLDETRSSECNWAWKGRADSVPVREIALHSSTDKRKAYCIGSIPGECPSLYICFYFLNLGLRSCFAPWICSA